MADRDIERLEEKIDTMLAILHGDNRGEMGVIQKVNIMWTLALRWPLYTASAIAGALLTIVVQRLIP